MWLRIGWRKAARCPSAGSLHRWTISALGHTGDSGTISADAMQSEKSLRRGGRGAGAGAGRSIVLTSLNVGTDRPVRMRVGGTLATSRVASACEWWLAVRGHLHVVLDVSSSTQDGCTPAISGCSPPAYKSGALRSPVQLSPSLLLFAPAFRVRPSQQTLSTPHASAQTSLTSIALAPTAVQDARLASIPFRRPVPLLLFDTCASHTRSPSWGAHTTILLASFSSLFFSFASSSSLSRPR
ncbi:hypothetical protein WOLCODRAFT_165554 [Wolfiporia cocos MD-104 SS10]|uniref:Uncharacterized protein n=1 Tax=Wolfiporia cocos (strain MD-104) TaxID=742152 RepID=A0A2H3JS99_WOLCO|nr:hypothetical protein WOLCODRAFT_165554 [Wolfiporia cocos MD-104 SS10]